MHCNLQVLGTYISGRLRLCLLGGNVSERKCFLISQVWQMENSFPLLAFLHSLPCDMHIHNWFICLQLLLIHNLIQKKKRECYLKNSFSSGIIFFNKLTQPKLICVFVNTWYRSIDGFRKSAMNDDSTRLTRNWKDTLMYFQAFLARFENWFVMACLFHIIWAMNV